MNPLTLVAFMAVGAAATYGPPPSARAGYANTNVESSSYSSSYGGARQAHIPITSFTRDIQGSHADSTSFTTGNGISSSHNVQAVRGRGGSYMNENGQMVQSDTTVQMNGHSYHQAPEGQHISLTWSADENGFRAVGDHLPRPVEMPAEHAEAHRLALATAAASSSYGSSGSSYDSYHQSAPQPIRQQSYQQPEIRVNTYTPTAVRSSGY
ncbi:unnamed protein product [Orchesella dallaii]|uniref:Endocuticle structural glycoprotein SgAbd-2 n=1 Tax=Orchesella dallaii TaxID=48710 RepID=A0ABP1RWI4_9HEXA